MELRTCSVSKGKPEESSARHNDRKTVMKGKTKAEKEKFYSQIGHEHIHAEYTYLNEDLKIQKPSDAYDELFGKAIQEYNLHQKRKDRQIGKGKAIPKEIKEGRLKLTDIVHTILQNPKKDQERLVKTLALTGENAKKLGIPAFAGFKSLADLVNQYYLEPSWAKLEGRSGLTILAQDRKEFKATPTLGEALYEKQKNSKRDRPYYEFVIQFGSAKDYNKHDKNGNLLDKNGNVIVAKDKATRDKQMVSYNREDPNGSWQKSKKMLEKYYKNFEKRNPQLHIINASIHMDESTPHLHLQVVPVADREKRTYFKSYKDNKHKRKRYGLRLSPSLNGALETQGFKRYAKDNRKQLSDWVKFEQEAMKEILKENGYAFQKGSTNHIKDVREYAKVMGEVAEQSQKAKEQQEHIHRNKQVLVSQKKQIQVNQNKLDEIASYPKKLADFNSKKEKAKKEQEEAEKARDKALQQRREAEQAKLKADKQAKLANINLINQLNAQKEAQDKREATLKARKQALDVREYGGTSKQGNSVAGIYQREKKLQDREQSVANRENIVSQKETKLANFDKQLEIKQNELTQLNETVSAYRGTIEKRKKRILDQKTKEMHSIYAKKLQEEKDKNKTSSKLLTYASYIYHACAQEFIETLDPSTKKKYMVNHKESNNSLAYDLGRGMYKNPNDTYSGKTALDNCLDYAKCNKKRLWKAIKNTGSKFLKLVNTKQVKSLAKQFDEIDESGLSDTVVAQATHEQMKQEQERQADLEREKQIRRNRLKNMSFHVDTSKKHETPNPYDEFN